MFDTQAMTQAIGDKIEARLQELGIKARTVSVELFGKPDVLRDIMRGKSQHPRHDRLRAIEQRLNIKLIESDESAPTATLTDRLPQPGVVRSELWFQNNDTEGQHFLTVTAVSDPDFPHLQQYAFPIEGDVFDRKAGDGWIAICVAFEETELKLKDGMIVIFERSQAAGYLRQWAIRRVRKTEGGTFELHPESTNPKYDPLALPSKNPHESIEPRYLVRRFVSPLETF